MTCLQRKATYLGVPQGGFSESLMVDRGPREETARHDDNLGTVISGGPPKSMCTVWEHRELKPVWARQGGERKLVGGDIGEASGASHLVLSGQQRVQILLWMSEEADVEL